MPEPEEKTNKVLIAGLTPYFLERGTLYFKENFESICKKAQIDEWWKDNTVFIAQGERINFSSFLRKLDALGYSKAHFVEQKGEFSVRGGIIDVFAINYDAPLRIEFLGNRIENIQPFEVEAKKEIAIPRLKDPTEYERLWLADLRPEDYVVHLDHGIGLYRGMASANNESLRINEYTNSLIRKFAKDSIFVDDSEFYVLEYAPGPGGTPDRLLVPRDQATKLARYIGFETPTIHRLGTQVWAATKRKAKEVAIVLAQELLAIYQERVQAQREPYPYDDQIEASLSHSFIYEETKDQQRAIKEIDNDLSKRGPMDRLLCGDVGFGKTEVAIRTAARVAVSGKQVALLAPTTILAEQHLRTFEERLNDLPIKMEMLSRLTSKKDEKRIIEELGAGEIDIIIGTHRLLSKDVAFKDLGLVIIDEEQRFGVRHKETFKKLRANIDVLSLSATPIPRTLSLALSKFRDLSIIQTPPAGRLPIKTFVLPFSKKIVKEAIKEEIKRGGQVFYLWNRIESMELIRQQIRELAPKVPVAILHGRVREKELIKTMEEFRDGKIKILLATTIIENGLDLPNVNTLIVANASRLGLAQSYQLRGRIGRGEVPARAYFLYPARPHTKKIGVGASSLTDKGKERLRALREAQELGAGFRIALKDLEIRGAGNVLGKEQSGTVNKVGLNLYAQLLNEAVEELSNL